MTMLEANERLEQWLYDNSVEITPELLACAHIALKNYISWCEQMKNAPIWVCCGKCKFQKWDGYACRCIHPKGLRGDVQDDYFCPHGQTKDENQTSV